MTAKQATEETALVMRCAAAERGSLGGLRRVLLPFVHFFLELPRLLFVDEGQTGPAFLELEGVEESSISVIGP